LAGSKEQPNEQRQKKNVRTLEPARFFEEINHHLNGRTVIA
jgi:hypothetical protein